MQAKWERKFGRPDSQEVGLEAAILERVRNSSLVERPSADNVPGLKPSTDALDPDGDGRGACSLAVKRHREEPWSDEQSECRHE